MFVRGNGSASAEKKARIHTHARVPKVSWKRKAGGTPAQSAKNFAVTRPRLALVFSLFEIRYMRT